MRSNNSTVRLQQSGTSILERRQRKEPPFASLFSCPLLDILFLLGVCRFREWQPRGLWAVGRLWFRALVCCNGLWARLSLGAGTSGVDEGWQLQSHRRKIPSQTVGGRTCEKYKSKKQHKRPGAASFYGGRGGDIGMRREAGGGVGWRGRGGGGAGGERLRYGVVGGAGGVEAQGDGRGAGRGGGGGGGQIEGVICVSVRGLWRWGCGNGESASNRSWPRGAQKGKTKGERGKHRLVRKEDKEKGDARKGGQRKEGKKNRGKGRKKKYG
ncbi:hypothetical protein Tco_0454734 [Tanacetum coccineum]